MTEIELMFGQADRQTGHTTTSKKIVVNNKIDIVIKRHGEKDKWIDKRFL